MVPRSFGQSGVRTSPLIFGSMRLDPVRMAASEARQLLTYLIDHGVTTWHSSHEYESYAFFCELLRVLEPPAPVHVIKLGEPHFDAPRFRPERFVGLVEHALKALRTERIDIVQWMLRTTPNVDATRLPLLHACIGEVEATAAQLEAQGKIGALAVFPYTAATADVCLPREACDGLVTYVNLAEQEYVPYLADLHARARGCLAIRPLCGGALLDPETLGGQALTRLAQSRGISPERRAELALSWPLTHPCVSGVVVSVGTIAHAERAVSACAIAPDLLAFTRAREEFCRGVA